ncbi:membrane protease FtsH catalytic subunit [Actinomadura verrucosospora]|uniref:Membrane protease FtsH catalytic subunit n=1 Tax=Actinomadura verrucosospora TaxID=46165 RepID=A0A7D3ZDE8_ACTVE|nr:membrane protease FtsH catalytic subunit [Actinomadura verrucosospora]
MATAPPFPRTDTLLGTVQYADQAECTYIALVARLATAKASDRRALERDCDALIAALSSWTGVPADQLRNALGPKPPPPSPTGRPRDTAAAANDFPHDITQGIATTPMPPTSQTADRPTRQARPHHGPAQAA